jgi:hypothetical protein
MIPAKATCRRKRRMTVRSILEEFLDDSRYALRQMKLAPGFTATVIVSLSLTLAANIAIFCLIRYSSAALASGKVPRSTGGIAQPLSG